MFAVKLSVLVNDPTTIPTIAMLTSTSISVNPLESVVPNALANRGSAPCRFVLSVLMIT